MLDAVPVRWPALELEIVRQRSEEPGRDRHDALVPTLALGDEHPPLTRAQIPHPQAEDLTAPQPTDTASEEWEGYRQHVQSDDPDPGHAAAIEAVARMLPHQIPPGGEYAVARAAVAVALPALLDKLRPLAIRAVFYELAALHVPTAPDHDGLTVCIECGRAWRCTTARLCAETLDAWPG